MYSEDYKEYYDEFTIDDGLKKLGYKTKDIEKHKRMLNYALKQAGVAEPVKKLIVNDKYYSKMFNLYCDTPYLCADGTVIELYEHGNGIYTLEVVKLDVLKDYLDNWDMDVLEPENENKWEEWDRQWQNKRIMYMGKYQP